MRGRKAKAIRQRLLPNTRSVVGASRGQVMRALTEYDIEKKHNNVEWFLKLKLKPGCPRQVYQAVKRSIKKREQYN